MQDDPDLTMPKDSIISPLGSFVLGVSMRIGAKLKDIFGTTCLLLVGSIGISCNLLIASYMPSFLCNLNR